jgi:hypothetical protein
LWEQEKSKRLNCLSSRGGPLVTAGARVWWPRQVRYLRNYAICVYCIG